MTLAKYKASDLIVKHRGHATFGLFILAFSNIATASCSFYNGATSEIRKDINFGSIIVQRDSPAGTVLATISTGPYHSSYPFFGCNTSWTYRWTNEIFTVLSPLANRIYNTNIDGVGISTNNESNTYIVPYDEPLGANNYISIPRGMRVRLIKTKAGAVGAGTLTTGRIARASIVGNFYTANITLVGVNTIVPVACSITSASINVPMGDGIPMSTFTGPGSVAAETPFAIELNCDANTRVQVKLDGSPHASAVEGVLALNSTPSGTMAKGIGLQLLHNSTPVKLATNITVGTVTNDGNYSIPLTARYYQTGASVSGGVANSTATFTLTYN